MAAPALASPQSPAVAWSAGVVRINGADHSGSGNLLPGAKLDTLASSGNLYLADGTRLRLAAATRLSVQPQTIALEGGAARIDAISAANRPLNISAGELQITASSGTVQRLRPNEIIVTATTTNSEVRKSNGTLIAYVRPGQTIAFSVPANASQSNETLMTGRVTAANGQYFLTDETTNLRTELSGGQPAQFNGKRVQARGELFQDTTTNRSKLVVKQYAMLQSQSGANPPNPSNTTPTTTDPETGTPNTTPPAATPPTNPLPPIGPSVTGLSKGAIAAISAGVIAAVGASIGLVSSGGNTSNTNSNISQ